MPKYLGNTTARDNLTAIANVSGNSLSSTTSVNGASAAITGEISYGSVTDDGDNVQLTPASSPQSAFIRSTTGIPRFFRFRASGSPAAPSGCAFSYLDLNHFYINNVNTVLNIGYNTGTFSGLTFTSPVVTVSNTGTITTANGNIAAPNGSLTAASASISGTATIGTLNFTGALSGTSATYTGLVSAGTLSSSGNVSGNALFSDTSVSAATAVISGTATVGGLQTSGTVNCNIVLASSGTFTSSSISNLTVTELLHPLFSAPNVIYASTTPSTNALTSGSITVYYELLGNRVTITLPELTGTAAATITNNNFSFLASSGVNFTLPILYRPQTNQRFYNVIYKNGVESAVQIIVFSNGTIAASIQNWTSGDTIIFPGRSVTYLVYS